MQLTRAADYAVRALVHLAGLPPGGRATLAALAEATEAPEESLSKILQQLGRAGLLVSRRGGRGGFILASPPEQVSLLQVVEAIDGRIALNLCLQPGDSCNRKGSCPVHLVWAEAQEAMLKVLRRASLAQLARSTKEVR